jgi:hypothetical protein
MRAGSNTSTVALRVVGGDEKGIQCLGINWATLFLGDTNTRTLPFRLEESRVENNCAGEGQQQCKRQTHPLVREYVT